MLYPVQPTTTAGLLRQLGVQHRSVNQHRAAIAEWLRHNTASAELKLSLRADGFGLLLPRPHRQAQAS
ncbi:hypothetical protein [Mycobacterium sp.]|uniref:hypothetical protein n=1 Tax=Mycobacterium sp. TaxID=1785 RepID=UPI002C2E4CFE|nr:hypothetical protein [Mycobacterium sp.]HTQ16516.1 hypothetical protein [Mycobacterium sp.]